MKNNLKKILQCSDFFRLMIEGLNENQYQELLEKMEDIRLKPGEVLFKEGEASECMYILLEGLLRAEVQAEGTKKLLGIIRYGETVGEMGMINQEARNTTIRALRHSSLLKLSNKTFDEYCKQHPKILLNLLKFVVAKTSSTIRALENIYTYVSLAFVPMNKTVNIDNFVKQFYQLLSQHKKIKFFNSADYNTVDNKLIQELEEAERNYEHVIYKISASNHAISEYFISRAEKVFFVADSTMPAKKGHYINAYEENIIQRELILLYPRRMKSSHVGAWIKAMDFSHYHHIALDNIQDIERLVRIVTGKAVALVLSGGGTKGWVHAGVLKALEEAKIEVDVIGGTSIGAVIGAKYLMENNYDHFMEAMTKYAKMNEHPYRLYNLTFPLVSILNGRKITKATKMLFKHERIEHLWKPFFCVSCNLSKSTAKISTKGSLFRWMRATTAIPGIIPPITYKGNIYVDGAIINNLPVDIMRDYFDGKGCIIAVDLSYIHDETTYKLPPVINFWDAFVIKLKSLLNKHKVPKIHDIIMRARLIGNAQNIKRHGMRSNILLRPDLTAYKLLTEIKHTNELFEIGYRIMKEKIPDLKKILEK